MINGSHVIIYSEKPEEDRKFFKEVLKFPHVDVGGGWLIFVPKIVFGLSLSRF